MARRSDFPPSVRLLIALAALFWFGSAAAVRMLHAQTASRSPSVWDGVFTAAQADRGLAVFERSCAKCHQSDLRGDHVSEAPALVDEMFMASWSGQTVKDLFDKVKTKMPADSPGSLSTASALDVVAYLLKSNKFPAGKDELALGQESLTKVIAPER